MAQTLTLTSVTTDGGLWTHIGGNIYETDADAAVLEVSLSNPTDPLDHTAHSISFYVEESGGTFLEYGSASITYRLYEGATPRSSSRSFNPPQGAGGTASYTLDVTSEAAAISNYADLKLVITAVLNAGSEGTRFVYVHVGSPMTIPSLATPGVPTAVAATDGTYTDKVRVTWNAPSSSPGSAAVSYKIYRNDINNTTGSTLKASGVGTTTWDDTTGDAGKVYYYWVKATNPAGDSGFSTSNSGYILGVPAAPTGVSASDGTYANKIRITWNAVVGAVTYKIFRAQSDSIPPSPNWTGIATTSYDDTTANDNIVYYYWVKATNAQGDSAASSSNSGYTVLAPPVPQNFSASDGTYETKVALSWDASITATSYNLYRALAPAGSLPLWQTGITGTTYDDTTVVQSLLYVYAVEAVNEAGASGYSTTDTGYAEISGVVATVSACTAEASVSVGTVGIPEPNRIWRDLFTVFNPSNATFHIGVVHMEHAAIPNMGDSSAVTADHFTLGLEDLSLHHFSYVNSFPSAFISAATFVTSERGGAYMDRPDSIVAGFWSRGSYPDLDRSPACLLYELSMPSTDDLIPVTNGYPHYGPETSPEDCWVVLPATDYGMPGILKTLRRVGFWLIPPPDISETSLLELTVVPHPVNAQAWSSEAVDQQISVTGYSAGVTPRQPTSYAYVDFDPSENPGVSGSVSGEAFEIKIKLTNGIGIRRLMVELDIGGEIDTVDSQN